MHPFFATIILLVLLVAGLCAYLAECVTEKQHVTDKRFTTTEKEVITGVSVITVFVIVLMCFSYRDLRDHTIKQYLSGEIVEQVDYKTKKQNGVEVRKDSTITYVRVKAKK